MLKFRFLITSTQREGSESLLQHKSEVPLNKQIDSQQYKLSCTNTTTWTLKMTLVSKEPDEQEKQPFVLTKFSSLAVMSSQTTHLRQSHFF